MRKFLITIFFLTLFGVTALVLFSGATSCGGSDISTADIQMGSLESGLEQYRNIGGQYPTNEQGLDALLNEPKTGPLPRRWSQTIDEFPLDPWSTPFRYHYPGHQNPERPEIISAGPDKEFGSVDDQSNQDQ